MIVSSDSALPMRGTMTMLRRTALFAAAFWPSTSLAMAEPEARHRHAGRAGAAAGFQEPALCQPGCAAGRRSCGRRSPGSFDSVNPFIVKGSAVTGVRTYVFESLLGRNWNEPFSLYGLLAETIDVSDDRQTFTFKIRPEAKFSDGTPVTAADVVFSHGDAARQGAAQLQELLFQDHQGRDAGRAHHHLPPGCGRPRAAADRRPDADPLQGLLAGQGLRADDARSRSSAPAPM